MAAWTHCRCGKCSGQMTCRLDSDDDVIYAKIQCKNKRCGLMAEGKNLAVVIESWNKMHKIVKGGGMMENKLLTADCILKDGSGDVGSGFNRRVFGETYNEACGYPNPPNRGLYAGWQKADDLINEGKIYYTHIFRHQRGDSVCDGVSFPYGGTFVCNTCGQSRLNKPWWIVKVMKDGNAWCVVGESFVNLQESDNYAFGDTKEEALRNYEKLMMEKPHDR